MTKNEKGQVVRDDLRGRRFGNGIVPQIGVPIEADNGGTKWLFLCDCGRTPAFYVWAEILKRSPQMRCRLCRNDAIRIARTTHGKRHTKKYAAWRNMVDRCTNEKHEFYAIYGGRGVGVFEPWLKFENFDRDVPDPPPSSERMMLDRINNDGNYEPGNVKWSTPKESGNNRNTNKTLTLNGVTKTYSQWADSLEMDKTTIRKRVLKGWPVEKVLSTEDFRK